MKPLNILITRHYNFTQTHHTEIWFRSIQSELSKHFSLKITWLLYLPEKILLQNIPNNENLLYVQDFHNAVDVIKTLKPDLIISHEYPSLIDLAFFAASKNSASLFIKDNSESLLFDFTSKQISVKLQKPIPFFSSLASLFHVPSMPQLSEKNHTTSHRLKFLLQKFNFLVSTLFFSKLQFI